MDMFSSKFLETVDLHSSNELSRSRSSQVVVSETGRQTNTQTNKE